MTEERIQELIEMTRAEIAAGAEGLVFDPIPHTYSYYGKPMKSVSATCELFEAPFDSDYWAAKKAEEAGVSKGEILESWEKVSRTACDEGTEVHAYGEWKFYKASGLPIEDEDIVRVDKEIAEGTFVRESRMDAVDDCWDWLGADSPAYRLYPVAAENKIVNPELGYAGTFDLLFLCVTGDKAGLIIFDYKTNKNLFNTFRPRGGAPVAMQYPFHNMADCNAAHYSCQLSLYQLGLERVCSLPVMGRVLFWVNPIGAALVDANDKEKYKAAHKALEAKGEKSKWKYTSVGDIEGLKKLYGFSRVNRFGMLRLPYLGKEIKKTLEEQKIPAYIYDAL